MRTKCQPGSAADGNGGSVAGDEPLGWTEDRLLGGKLIVRQPRAGYRIAIDTLLLAATMKQPPAGVVVDVGAGVGGVALAAARRVKPSPMIVALERDAALASMLRANLRHNHLDDRVDVVVGDLARAPLAAGTAALVLTNPPYGARGDGTPPTTPLGRRARHEGELDLAGWLKAAAALVRPGGHLVAVHRADRLGELMAKAPGAATILPLWPQAGVPAKRVLVRFHVGRRGATKLLAGLVLHQGDGHFTSDADAILRGEAALDFD